MLCGMASHSRHQVRPHVLVLLPWPANREYPPRPRNRHALTLTQLEARDVPTLWYTVHLSSPPGGVQADNTASVGGPGLSIDSMRMFTDSDTALVEANSEAEAIQIVLTGSLEIGVSELELPATTYTFSSSTSSTSASAQAAYLISPTGGNTWQVALEDTAAYPTISDWDYNDFTWNLTVDGSTSLPPNYTAPYSPPPPPPYVPPDPYMGPYQYAVPDSATTDRDTPVTIPVIANDIQPTNGSSLSVGYASNGMYGTVTVAADGQSVIYTPNAGFTGMDSFYYVLAGSGDMATVYITVTGEPEFPPNPTNTMPDFTDPDPNAWWNKPTENYTAADWAAYNAYMMNYVPPTPTGPHLNAVSDTATTSRNTAVTISVLANDSDIDGHPLTVTYAGGGMYGTVTYDGTSVTYTPNAGYAGTDSFYYVIDDGNGATAMAGVNVTVYGLPLVSVDGPLTTVYPEENATFVDVPYTLHWIGEASLSSTDVQYRVTVLDGEDFTNEVSSQTFTTTFLPGQTSFASAVSLATADLNPELRVRIEVLPPAAVPGVPVPFVIDPNKREFKCQAKAEQVVITGAAVLGKDFIPTLVAAAKTEPGAKNIVETLLKDKAGVDITVADQQKKWEDSKLIFGVVTDNNDVVSGAALNVIKFSVQNFNKAPQKDKAMIIQVHRTTQTFYDKEGKKLGSDIEEIVIEGFAVDKNGVMVGLDVHGYPAKIGIKLTDGTVAKVQFATEWEVGWGVYAGKAPPQSGIFFQGPSPPEQSPVTWLGKTLAYESKYILDSKGQWFFIDDSTGVRNEGTGNVIKK